jgi:NAD(P)-dependent dehydrogenase (short-subunit alcohol dehydrogenase family)
MQSEMVAFMLRLPHLLPPSSHLLTMKTILITGASRGIGAATAILAAQRGYRVAVNYRANAQAARDVVETITREGGQAVAFQADVSVESEVLALFAAVERELGAINALVNNAGTLEPQMRLDEMEVDRLLRVVNSNLVSCFLCCREAVRRMSTKHGGQGGAIVNVSSVASRTGSPREYVDYAASKGAVDSLTIGLAHEVAAEGVRVNAVRPGFIATDIHASGGEPGRIERLTPVIPMQRGGAPEEVANAILWLLSDEASYTTGGFIDIAGGK